MEIILPPPPNYSWKIPPKKFLLQKTPPRKDPSSFEKYFIFPIANNICKPADKLYNLLPFHPVSDFCNGISQETFLCTQISLRQKFLLTLPLFLEKTRLFIYAESKGHFKILIRYH